MRIEATHIDLFDQSHPHITEETDDLPLPRCQPAVDRGETSLPVDGVKCLVDEPYSLSALARQSWNEHVVIPRLISHPPQERQVQEREVAGNHQAVVVLTSARPVAIAPRVPPSWKRSGMTGTPKVA